MTKDYRITVKIRNNRILKAIEAVGGTPGGKWCAANGLSYQQVNSLINMSAGPLTEELELRSVASKLCEVLGKLPEDLWSNDQLYPLERNFADLEMSHEQVVALLPQEQQSYLSKYLEQEQMKALVSKVVSTLRPKEQAILKMRFEDGLTFEECGKRFGVSRERIRQIETRALQKLRSPGRAGLLAELMDFSEGCRPEIT